MGACEYFVRDNGRIVTRGDDTAFGGVIFRSIDLDLCLLDYYVMVVIMKLKTCLLLITRFYQRNHLGINIVYFTCLCTEIDYLPP